MQINLNHFWSNHFDDSLSTQIFIGPTWYHYFGTVGHSFYTAAGIGNSLFSVRGIGYREGPGVLLGGGYEFSKQVQLGVYMTGGKTKDTDKPDYKHIQLTVTLSVIAY